MRPSVLPGTISRRQFLSTLSASAGATALTPTCLGGPTSSIREPWFKTRGALLLMSDIETYDWPALAKQAGLSTLAAHIRPSEIEGFTKRDVGRRFLEDCRRLGIIVEYELHALGDLLPRELFDRNPTMFRMDENGRRMRDYNLCVHSRPALEVVAENAMHHTRTLHTSTHRYFYWIDDAQPMCRCPQCRPYSDSDQALIFENHVWRAIRKVDRRATLAHLAYDKTLTAPTQVKPERGIFLEFAPIERRYDRPFRQREVAGTLGNLLHGRMLDALDANLEWFGREGAQALEYWLDVSRFASWKREKTIEIPWHNEVFRNDLELYAKRGIRHVTTFAAWLDGDYTKRWNIEPVKAYGAGLSRWRRKNGQPVEV